MKNIIIFILCISLGFTSCTDSENDYDIVEVTTYKFTLDKLGKMEAGDTVVSLDTVYYNDYSNSGSGSGSKMYFYPGSGGVGVSPMGSKGPGIPMN